MSRSVRPRLLAPYSVKERIFLYYMVFFAIASLLTVAINIAYGLAFSLNYKWFVIFLFCSLAAIAAIKQWAIKWVHSGSVFFFVIVLLPVSWLSSAGLDSPSVVYFLAVLLLINFVLNRYARLIANGLLISISILMISFYFYRRELFATLTPDEQFLDWVTHVPAMLGFMALQLTTFARAYEQERQQSADKTRQLSLLSKTDPLTGVENRLHMMDDINRCLAGHRDQSSALLIMDIDHFKRFNDLYGHIKGDECLQAAASILMQSVKRKTDKVYRYGGEEFIVLFTQTDAEGALAVAEQVRQDIERAAIPHQHAPDGIVTASFGLTTFRAGEQSAAKVILQQADQALYQAKRDGRNQVKISLQAS